MAWRLQEISALGALDCTRRFFLHLYLVAFWLTFSYKIIGYVQATNTSRKVSIDSASATVQVSIVRPFTEHGASSALNAMAVMILHYLFDHFECVDSVALSVGVGL